MYKFCSVLLTIVECRTDKNQRHRKVLRNEVVLEKMHNKWEQEEMRMQLWSDRIFESFKLSNTKSGLLFRMSAIENEWP